MTWRPGTQYELCECTECHDQACHEHLWSAFSVAGRFLCRVLGHKPGVPNATTPTACLRRCGYVAVASLPTAIVVR